MSLKEIKEVLLKLNNVVIFTHKRPDGDTIGSALALKGALESLGKSVTLSNEDDIPEKFSYLNGHDCFKKYEEIIGNFDGYISVDCAQEMMFGCDFQNKKNAITVNIDHHISNEKYAKYNYVEERGACCEIVYNLIKELGVEITEDIAKALMTGIITDTGMFEHSNATSATLSIASDLFEHGANIHNITEYLFRMQPKERAILYGRVMNKMRFYLDDKLSFIIITHQDLVETKALSMYTEGFIDFPLSIKGMEVAISLLEVGKNRYKISFRSSGKVNVNEIASLYGGGGHELASGAMLNGHIEDIIDKLTYNVKQRL